MQTKSDAAYQDKAFDYFALVRREILPLLPEHSDRIFEVGCGAANTLAYLKSSGRCNWAGGLELFHDAAEAARSKIDLVLEGNIEAMDLPLEESSLDVILCLDVLEHLVDPWTVVGRLHKLLKPGGMLLCSIPNIRYYRVSLALLLFGRWRYTPSGILDKTHLRFFTRQTAIDLVASSGLVIDRVETTGLEKGRRERLYNRATLGMFKPFFDWQYLIRGLRKQ